MIGNILMVIAIMTTAIFFYCMLFTRKDKNLVYIQYVLIAFPFIGIDLFPSLLTISIFDLTTLIFVTLFYKRKNVYNRENKLYQYLFFILSIIMIIGSILSEELTRESVSSVIQFVSIFIFAKILSDEISFNSSFTDEIINCIKITLIFSLVFLVGQFVLGPSFSIAKSQNINVTSLAGIRYPSFFQDPQKYAQFLSAASFLMLVKEWEKENISTINVIIFILTVAAMLFTGGRAGFGGWILGILIIMAAGSKKYRTAIIAAALIIIPGIIMFADQIPMFKRESVSDSFDFRYLIWQDAYKIFLDNPLFGIGIGNYANYVSIHNPDQFWIANNEITIYDHPESGYLKLLTEFGLLGFTSIMGMIAMPIIIGFKKYQTFKNTTTILLIASIATWLIGFYTVYSFGDVRIKILMVTIICMLITIDNSVKEKIV
jgi:O-antigen ligase